MNLHSTGPTTIYLLLKPQIQNSVQELRLASLCWKKIVQDFWLPALPGILPEPNRDFNRDFCRIWMAQALGLTCGYVTAADG